MERKIVIFPHSKRENVCLQIGRAQNVDTAQYTHNILWQSYLFSIWRVKMRLAFLLAATVKTTKEPYNNMVLKIRTNIFSCGRERFLWNEYRPRICRYHWIKNGRIDLLVIWLISIDFASIVFSNFAMLLTKISLAAVVRWNVSLPNSKFAGK